MSHWNYFFSCASADIITFIILLFVLIFIFMQIESAVHEKVVISKTLLPVNAKVIRSCIRITKLAFFPTLFLVFSSRILRCLW